MRKDSTQTSSPERTGLLCPNCIDKSADPSANQRQTAVKKDFDAQLLSLFFCSIEGTSFGEVNERVDVDALNARICSMLGAPAVFAINCARLTTPSGESGLANLAPRQVPNVEKEFQEHLVSGCLVFKFSNQSVLL